MRTAWLYAWLRRPWRPVPARSDARAPEQAPDEISAELSDHYWHAYTERMATVRLTDIARRFPGLVGRVLRLRAVRDHRSAGSAVRRRAHPAAGTGSPAVAAARRAEHGDPLGAVDGRELG